MVGCVPGQHCHPRRFKACHSCSRISPTSKALSISGRPQMDRDHDSVGHITTSIRCQHGRQPEPGSGRELIGNLGSSKTHVRSVTGMCWIWPLIRCGTRVRRPLSGKIFDRCGGGLPTITVWALPRCLTYTPASAIQIQSVSKNAGFDLTSIAWPASYNVTVPAIMRTRRLPVSPILPTISCGSQGQSFIQDRTRIQFGP